MAIGGAGCGQVYIARFAFSLFICSVDLGFLSLKSLGYFMRLPVAGSIFFLPPILISRETSHRLQG